MILLLFTLTLTLTSLIIYRYMEHRADMDRKPVLSPRQALKASEDLTFLPKTEIWVTKRSGYLLELHYHSKNMVTVTTARTSQELSIDSLAFKMILRASEFVGDL